MKIRTQHMTLGAALMQIAEHERFTAINPLYVRGNKVTNAFLINDSTCIFLKYGSEPKPTGEYQFTFTAEQISSLEDAEEHYRTVFVCLVCVEAQDICGLTADELHRMITARQDTVEGDEESYQVLITAPENGRLRVYTNTAGRRGVPALEPLLIPRNRFPGFLFE
ncbi:hypothetical protein SRABI130_02846 [Pseudomonas sp. Bi130]|uniref:hypothetical protein n=1 Tax=Pseudomonas sp. Bi130 TaxID=2821122 RepID=UPI001D2F5232|nr:hypothetical protein [Pseudomonas sp. Bi130]CAH0235143.1 hypothetical protein SRABI130_02846 [Pseudomonas sp. Bi130]